MAPNSAQNSENLGFGFLSLPIGGFNPNLAGTYDFTLTAYLGTTVLGSDTAKVSVSTVPDGGNTIAMLGFAACGLLVFKRGLKIAASSR